MNYQKINNKTVIYSQGSVQNPIGFKTNLPTEVKSTNFNPQLGNSKTNKNHNIGQVGLGYGGHRQFNHNSTHNSIVPQAGYNQSWKGNSSSSSMSPTKAFTYNGIEFWGSAKTNLEKFSFKDNDLIINCTGMPISIKPFVKNLPNFINIGGIGSKLPSEILLDWPDFKIPPLSINIDFFKKIIKSATENKINRIFVCCTAGQGRTGTCLSAFAMATEGIKHHEKAIAFIRHEYSSHAVESKIQEDYLEFLALEAGYYRFPTEQEGEDYTKNLMNEFYKSKNAVDLGKFKERNFDDIIEEIKNLKN